MKTLNKLLLKSKRMPNGCLVFQGQWSQRYPVVRVEELGKCFKAHRAAWILTNGAVPDGLCVLHRCDNGHCLEPRHLWLGTQEDNMEDMHRKGRSDAFTRKLTEAQVAEIKRLINCGYRTGQLAAMFGVCSPAISHIKVGRRWRRIRASASPPERIRDGKTRKPFPLPCPSRQEVAA